MSATSTVHEPTVACGDSLDHFRQETRTWLEENCPPEMREPMVSEPDRCWGGSQWVFSCDAQRVWLQRMVEKGWTVPQWPREYGGAALSGDEAAVLREEMDALDCRPPLLRVSQSLGMIGPTVLKIGTEAQKRQHLLPIARGEVRWCQGYSEPGAGSDLAAVQVRAEDKGDHFLVSGQKIWTSHANRSDWMFLLVRTDPSAPKHEGITFLMLDLKTPGIEIRTIQLISGWSAFCEVFLDKVRVPKDNVLGPINRGWEVSRLLLSHERNSIATARTLTAGEALGVTAARLLGSTGQRVPDAALRAEVAQYEVDALAFSALTERASALARSGNADAGHASLLKIAYSELDQRRQDLLMSAGGAELLALEGGHTEEGKLARAWLRSRGNTIEGGTTEIQLNILAKRVLGLPGG